ncbi:MAG: ABC transporter permease, partial [Acidobacteria bacterium]|nr:ABC transporter permease [Acidobacteriota bacterium]
MTLFRTFIVRALRQQRLRSAVTVASLAVGVGVVVAIQLANGASVRGFETALEAIAGRTSLEITASGGELDETRLVELDWLREYGLVSPVIDADVVLAVTSAAAAPRGRDGPDSRAARFEPAAGPPVDPPAALETVRLLGVDILRDRPFRDYPLLEGDAVRETTTEAFLDRLTDPRSVILTRARANRHGVAIGDPVALAAGERWARLHVTGILGADGPAQVLDGNFALMDIAAAQWAVGSLGRLDRVDVRLADGVDVGGAERDISQRLPAGLTVRRPSARGAEVERMLRAFHFNLTALSLIALLVGLFLVYNTVSVSVIARRAEIGTLRTLGASRAAVAALFLGEAAALSVVGSAIGAPLGWGMAHGAVSLTSSTVSQFWIASAAEVPPLDATTVAIAFAVGVPLALAAAAVPALEASRVAPLASVRGDRDLALRARLPRRFIAGPAVLLAAGALLALPGPVGGLPVF